MRIGLRSTKDTKLNGSSLFSIKKKLHVDQSDFNQRHKTEYLVLIFKSYSLDDRSAINQGHTKLNTLSLFQKLFA